MFLLHTSPIRALLKASAVCAILVSAVATEDARSHSAESAAQPSPATRPAASRAAAKPFFVGDFETGNLSQWPDLSNANGNTIISTPAGGPAGSSKMMKVSVTNAADSSAGGDASYVQRHSTDSWQREGSDTWYRARVLFPSGNDARYPGSFQNQSSSGWNMVMEWHEPAVGSSSPYIGVSNANSLMVRWVGGTGQSVWVYDAAALRKDHWYDLVVHVVWSRHAERGKLEWWVDGRKTYPSPGGKDVYGKPLPATLATMWRNPRNGRSASPYLQVGHYRGAATHTDTLYVDGIRIGPRRASLAG